MELPTADGKQARKLVVVSFAAPNDVRYPPTTGPVLSSCSSWTSQATRYRIYQHVSSRRAPSCPTNPSRAGKQWLLVKSWQNGLSPDVWDVRGESLASVDNNVMLSNKSNLTPEQRPAARIRSAVYLKLRCRGFGRDGGMIGWGLQVVVEGLSTKALKTPTTRLHALSFDAFVLMSHPIRTHFPRKPPDLAPPSNDLASKHLIPAL